MELFDKRLVVTDGDGFLGQHVKRPKIVRYDEIHNLGVQSHVKVSFDIPVYTAEVTGVGTIRLIETMRDLAGCGFGRKGDYSRRPRTRGNRSTMSSSNRSLFARRRRGEGTC